MLRFPASVHLWVDRVSDLHVSMTCEVTVVREECSWGVMSLVSSFPAQQGSMAGDQRKKENESRSQNKHMGTTLSLSL